ncbi:MAG: MerR family transcriptional regulator [Deltaproteobacteria bacterium]|nr:MAG: MerR family transcriptional regulator [Deltaproteobacteria bacterium]
MAYWINNVSEMTGIPKSTLIAWERRYRLVEPKRAPSGYRLYTDEDVALLQRVKALLDAGHRISTVAEIVKREARPATTMEAPATPLPGGLESLRNAALEALLAFDRAEVDRVLSWLFSLPFETLIDQVILPILHEIGARWEAGEVTVVQEHYVSAWSRERILTMARGRDPGPTAPEAVCATPPGELHELGLLAAAFRLANRGYRLLYLGTDVPTDQLLALLRDRQPALVALSVVRERDDFDVLAYAERVLEALGPEGEVIVGGWAAAGLAHHSRERLRFGDAAEG